jgi:peptide deformylase
VAEEAGEVVTDEELDVQAQARRQLALAQIRQYPDPALRMKAGEVTEFDGALKQLVARMGSLMVDARGVGLAATQVGILQRVFVFSAVDDEGCLSMQRVLVPVERSVRVTLVGKDEEGEDVRLELEGMPARVVQHEVDHLDGVLILDRTTEDARREAMATLRAQLTLA